MNRTLCLLVASALVALTCQGCRCSEPPRPVNKSTPTPAPTVPHKKAPTKPAPPPSKPPTRATKLPAAPLPGPATPVRGFRDAARLLDIALKAVSPLATGETLGLWRVSGDDRRHEQLSFDDGALQWAVPSLQLVWTKRGHECTSGATKAPKSARCKGDDAAKLNVLAALWATTAATDGRLTDVRVEAVELTKQEHPRLRLSSAKAGTRWWLEFDERAQTLLKIAVNAGGVDAALNVSNKRGNWPMTVAGEAAGEIRLTDEDAGAEGGRARLLEVALSMDVKGDPLDFAQRRLQAMRKARGWLTAGPVGIRFGWLAGKLTVRAAVLPVLGAQQGAPGLIEPKEGEATVITVQGRQLEQALKAGSVADGCWIGLILGGSLKAPQHAAIVLLPCAGEAG